MFVKSYTSIDKTHVAIKMDKKQKVIHVLDLNLKGTSLTNSIDIIYNDIAKDLFVNAEDYQWILYHTDNHISQVHLNDSISFTNVPMDCEFIDSVFAAHSERY